MTATKEVCTVTRDRGKTTRTAGRVCLTEILDGTMFDPDKQTISRKGFAAFCRVSGVYHTTAGNAWNRLADIFIAEKFNRLHQNLNVVFLDHPGADETHWDPSDVDRLVVPSVEPVLDRIDDTIETILNSSEIRQVYSPVRTAITRVIDAQFQTKPPQIGPSIVSIWDNLRSSLPILDRPI